MRLIAFVLFCSALSAEVILTVTKTSYEAFICTMDFTQVIGTDGMTLASVTAMNGNVDVTPAIIGSSPAPSILSNTDKVAFRVQGGTSGASYKISVKVVDAIDGSQYEGQMVLTVSN